MICKVLCETPEELDAVISCLGTEQRVCARPDDKFDVELTVDFEEKHISAWYSTKGSTRYYSPKDFVEFVRSYKIVCAKDSGMEEK